MANETLRYLKLDFASHKNALLQRVRARWPRLWNDFLSNSFGIVLVELMAWVTTTLAFAINRLAGENYINTMTMRESAVRIGSNFGYALRGPVPASLPCEAVITTPQTVALIIAQGTPVRTAGPVPVAFEVSQDYTIEPGNLAPIQLIVEIAPGLSGANTLAALAVVTNGSVNVDLTDSSIDLTQYVQAGQVFATAVGGTEYGIVSIEGAPGAISNNRIVLADPWTGATGTTQAVVYDKRILLTQGQTVSDRYVSPANVVPNYSVRLTQTPVIEGSPRVLVNSAVWTRVSSFAEATADEEVFLVQTLTTGETIVTFGNGVFGKAIPTEALIELTYRVGGGTAGNVGLNSISTSITGLLESTSSPVTVTLSNTTSTGQGGRDAETLEEARVNIPYYVRANDRAVTLDDYQTLAQQFTDPAYGSVAYVRSLVRYENSLLEGNVVTLYAWTTGHAGGLANLSPQLKQALIDYMRTKAVGTDYVQVLDGLSQPVPISLRFKAYEGFSVVDTQRLVEETVNTTINALRPGQTLIFSDMVRSLDEVYGVASLEMSTPLQNLDTGSTIELLTVPQADFVYNLARNGAGTPVYSEVDGAFISLYEAQLPVFPVKAWSIRLFLGANELTVMPDLTAGYAMLLGENLSDNTEQAEDKTYLYRSRVNLLTGKVQLWLVGAPGDLTMQLIPVQGYSVDRNIDLYIGYTGENTQTKRREIRAALRSWSDGLAIGGTLYATQISGVTASRSNVTDVVASLNGVTSVTRVALDTAASAQERLTALDTELFALASIYVNNQVD